MIEKNESNKARIKTAWQTYRQAAYLDSIFGVYAPKKCCLGRQLIMFCDRDTEHSNRSNSKSLYPKEMTTQKLHLCHSGKHIFSLFVMEHICMQMRFQN